MSFSNSPFLKYFFEHKTSNPNIKAHTNIYTSAKLIGLYISPNYRKLGIAKSLIAAGMKLLSERGVTHVEADVIRRNEAQRLLANSCGATFIRTACFYPGINYD
ncbi:MAG: GNAT family N-acetyltransferase [Clostridia bacterium]